MLAHLKAAVLRQPEPLRNAVVTLVLVALTTVIYYLIPVPKAMRDSSWVILFCCGTVVLAVGIWGSVRRLLMAGPETRIRSLVMYLTVTVLFFSWAYTLLAKSPGQFSDLHTKTDAIYFCISTLATVGFGDVHAAGQVARAAVTVQMLFNLVFIGTAVAMVSGLLRERARRRATAQRPGPAAEPGPESGTGSGA